MWSVGSAGRWANDWSDFAPNVLSIRVFPRLKILSQKCLFLKSLVFRELAGFAGRTLKNLREEEKRGRERKREEETKRQRDKERKREEEREKERKKEERSGRDRGRRTKRPFYET